MIEETNTNSVITTYTQQEAEDTFYAAAMQAAYAEVISYCSDELAEIKMQVLLAAEYNNVDPDALMQEVIRDAL